MAAAACTTITKYPVSTDYLAFSAVASHSMKGKGIITTTNYPLDVPFVVEAVHYPNGQNNPETIPFMESEKVEYNFENAMWMTEKQYMWPLTGNLVFYAGSPIIPQLTVSAEKGVEADWEIPDNQHTQTDLCFASASEKCESHIAVVPIVFSHALSQVCFKARTIKQYSSSQTNDDVIQANVINVVLDSVKVRGVASKGHFTQIPLGWSYDPSHTAEYDVFKSTQGLELRCDRYDSPILADLASMLLLPQMISKDACIEEWHHINIRTSLTDKQTGEIVSDEKYTIYKQSTIDINTVCSQWYMDYKYTFHLSVGLDESDLAMAVTDWTETKEMILGE